MSTAARPQSGPSTGPPAGPRMNPAETLAVSRERLRRAVFQTDAAVDSRDENGSGPGDPSLPPSEGLPSAALLTALVRHWWRRHPWRQAGAMAMQAADALARPVAQTHPAALMAGAAAAGAVLVWARPWRLLHGAWGPLSAGLLPALLPRLLRVLVPPPSA